MILHPPGVSTARFTYDPPTRTFVAEASDLGGLRMGRVFDDACDVGFTLVSDRTGREVVFVASHTERDPEGDVRWEDFEPVNGSAAPAVKVRIFND